METFADYNSINLNQLLSAIRLTSKEGTENLFLYYANERNVQEKTQSST